MSDLLSNQIKLAEQNCLNWLIHSYKKYGVGGFPHSRWMYLPAGFAWQKDYPETSGYLIENLIKSNRSDAQSIAISCAQWLRRLQTEDGYYHSGVRFTSKSAFNTAQILFGLRDAFEYTNDASYFEAMEKSYLALIQNIDSNGIFKHNLYQKGYFATYYSRCIWPLLKIDQKYYNGINKDRLNQSLYHLFNNKNEHSFFNNCGFIPDQAALSHPVAYALEGFLESAILLQDELIEKYILEILSRMCIQVQEQTKIPAYYYNNLTGDYSFICVTGQIQMAAIFLKAYQRTLQKTYKTAAEVLLPAILQWQIKSRSADHKGAFPSSIPIWKNYFPFRYTNWTAKFFLDLCQLWESLENIQDKNN